MSRYYKQEVFNNFGDARKRCYYKMVKMGVLDIDDITDIIAGRTTGMGKGDLKAAMTAIVDEILLQVSKGYHVEIEGLGCFRACVGVKRGRVKESMDEEQTKRNAVSLMVSDIRFRASKRAIARVNLSCRLTRGKKRSIRCINSSKEERLRMMIDFISTSENKMMKVSDYMRITGMSKSVAQRELVEIREAPGSQVTTIGHGAGLCYTLRQKEG